MKKFCHPLLLRLILLRYIFPTDAQKKFHFKENLLQTQLKTLLSTNILHI